MYFFPLSFYLLNFLHIFANNTVLSRAKVCFLHYNMRHTHKKQLHFLDEKLGNMKQLDERCHECYLVIYSSTPVSFSVDQHTVHAFCSRPTLNLRTFLFAWPPPLDNRRFRRIAKSFYCLCNFFLSVCVRLSVLMD